MDSPIEIKDALSLRHQLQSMKRLRLEFLASLSNLLREYDVSVDDVLLDRLILATPDELTKGTPFIPNQTTNEQKDTGVWPSTAESEMVSHVLKTSPTATLFNVVLARNPEARVLNLVLSPPSAMTGPGPQPGGGSGSGPQTGPGPQPG